MQVEVKPIAGALGAEIAGVDLSAELDNETFDAIHQALLDHCVIFFRDQKIRPEQQLTFARRFGDIHLHPYVAGLPDLPEVLEIYKAPDEKRNFGGVWHTDQMFNVKPAMLTMLYAKETPDSGGDTMFANMYAAYDGLSDGMKDMLSRLKTANYGNSGADKGQGRKERYASMKGMTVKDPGDIPEMVEHPLIRTHPETGRKLLYIGNHTKHFAGMTRDESAPLREYLMTHATRPEYTCRFRWQPGSMAIWDNRCVQHNAVNDYHGQARRMHRITVSGDVPF